VKDLQVRSDILKITGLSDETIDEMYRLFENYYVDISTEQFRKDLFEKTHVFIFRSMKSRELVGFSTIFRRPIPAIGPGLFIFSGDTVLREDYWGSKILQKAFFRYITQSKMLSPLKPVYWMLISKGYKTYMMMRRNFSYSFPSSTRPTPASTQQILDRFYHWKFGDSYDPKTGLITFETAKGSVKGGIADPSEAHARDPNVRYFLEKNPDYRKGVELACVAEIRASDFLGHVPKYFSPFTRRPDFQK
jgi:hypothetical protein